MRLADAQAATRIDKSENFDKWRTRIGRTKFEHRVRKGEHIGVWVWAPGWFSAFALLRDASESPKPSDDDYHRRLRSVRLENAELDLAERRVRHAERTEKLITVAESDEAMRSILGAVARFANSAVLSVEQKRLFSEALIEAEQELAEHEKEKPTTPANAGRPESLPAGDRDRHPEVKRIKRPRRSRLQQSKRGV